MNDRSSPISGPHSGRTLFNDPAVVPLREDLALALRAAAHFGLGEGVCNHFSVALPEHDGLFLLNPRGLMWNEIQADDIVIVDANGDVVAGRHAVEPTAMFIHAAVHNVANKPCVLHTHMPYATALTLTVDCGLDTTLSQNAMRFYGRVALDREYNGLALDIREGERIAHALDGKDIGFLGNHGVVVCGERIDYAFDDLYYLERACEAQVIALSTGRPLKSVDETLARRVASQIQGERLQSELFFEALRRALPDSMSSEHSRP
ncbi:MAG TPA: aldolase [Pararobbsia sp.]|nr:aldolase [Pararobbsia sp.]